MHRRRRRRRSWRACAWRALRAAGRARALALQGAPQPRQAQASLSPGQTLVRRASNGSRERRRPHSRVSCWPPQSSNGNGAQPPPLSNYLHLSAVINSRPPLRAGENNWTAARLGLSAGRRLGSGAISISAQILCQSKWAPPLSCADELLGRQCGLASLGWPFGRERKLASEQARERLLRPDRSAARDGPQKRRPAARSSGRKTIHWPACGCPLERSSGQPARKLANVAPAFNWTSGGHSSWTASGERRAASGERRAASVR